MKLKLFATVSAALVPVLCTVAVLNPQTVFGKTGRQLNSSAAIHSSIAPPASAEIQSFSPLLANESGVVFVATAHGTDCPKCYSNDCYEEGRTFGATCATLSVNLPLTAQIDHVEFYTNAAGARNPDADFPDLRRVDMGSDVGWMWIDNYNVSYQGSIKVVQVKVHNRSCHRAARQVKVVVFYRTA